MLHNSINYMKIAALAALVAIIGTASSAFAAETGYGPVQLITAQQIDDPAGPCKSEDTPGGITRAMAPRYPQIAFEEGLEGFSTVTFTMALDGSASNVKLAGTSGNRWFDLAAVEAVKSSRFVPATQNCSKIAGLYGVPVVFSLSNAPDWPSLYLVGGGSVGGGRPLIK